MHFNEDSEQCSENVTAVCETKAEYIGYIYFFTPTAILGVLLNTLNIIVFVGEKSRGSTITYLTALACFDLATVIISSPAGCIRCLSPPVATWQYMARNVYEVYIYLPLSNIFGTASVWCTMVLTTERYLYVRQFPWARKLFTPLRQKISIALLLVTSSSLNFPFFFWRRLDEDGNIVVTTYSHTLGYHVFLWLRFAVVKLLPIIVVAVANGLLLKVVVDTNKRQKTRVHPAVPNRHAQRQRLQNHMSQMLVSISVVFLICHVPESFSHSTIYAAIHGHCQLYSEQHRIQVMVTNTLEIVSYAYNFIFYCIFHKQFQIGLKKLCWCYEPADELPKLPTVWEESQKRGENSASTAA